MASDSSTHQAAFRFFAALNDFLEPCQRGQWIEYRFGDFPGIKDPIEALGVPHTEVDVIVVNGASVDFGYQLHHGDRVAVYPPFFQVDVSPLIKLREPLAEPTFVLDAHLGKLAKLLRLVGLDVLYRNDYQDPELVDISEREGRVLLTRDRRLLFHRRVVYGRFVRNVEPMAQAREIIDHYNLEAQLKPFSRCTACNGAVAPVNKADIIDRLEPLTARYYDEFYQCGHCGKIYWRGAHFAGLLDTIKVLSGLP